MEPVSAAPLASHDLPIAVISTARKKPGGFKALLPEYKDRVRGISIDPPSTTGHESWVYNDDVRDPKIVLWLGQGVGKGGDDLCRHDKGLCMMHPRLQLLRWVLMEETDAASSLNKVDE